MTVQTLMDASRCFGPRFSSIFVDENRDNSRSIWEAVEGDWLLQSVSRGSPISSRKSGHEKSTAEPTESLEKARHGV